MRSHFLPRSIIAVRGAALAALLAKAQSVGVVPAFEGPAHSAKPASGGTVPVRR